MQFIAHRGLVNNTIDNSLESLVNALKSDKFIGIETDIRATKDNVFILYHNPLYKGKLIKNYNYKDIKQDIDSLEDLLKYKTDKILLLEIKDFNINLKDFIKLLDKYKRNIFIMSFSNKVIKEISKLNTSYKLGILNYVFNTIDNYNYDFICILNDLLSESLINHYNKKNIKILSYGIRSYSNIKFNNLTYIIDYKKMNI